MSYSREHIGNVQVVSGRLVLLDPKVLESPDVAKIAQMAPSAAALADEGSDGEILDGLAVAFESPFRDGSYPVFASRNDKGEIVSVEIQLEA